jgi:flagellar basal-body rod modification protein FlgD
MSLASIATQQSNALAAATAAQASAAAASNTGAAATIATPNPLVAISSNFTDFLQMLMMTQLQNQDPTGAMGTSALTSELVEFSGVEQQINTNAALTQLIQLTQAGETMQGTAMTGRSVTVQSTEIALQNSSGTLNFNDPTAGTVAIAITTSSGQPLYETTVNATAGQNAWTWNGTTSAGAHLPDGAHNIVVVGSSAAGATTSLPFTVTGTATGVESLSSGMQLEIGALLVPFGAVQSVGN